MFKSFYQIILVFICIAFSYSLKAQILLLVKIEVFVKNFFKKGETGKCGMVFVVKYNQ